MKAINNLIASDISNLGPGFCIGHSFFCTPNGEAPRDREWYERVITTEIAPLVREYWFDDEQKAKNEIDELLRAA